MTVKEFFVHTELTAQIIENLDSAIDTRENQEETFISDEDRFECDFQVYPDGLVEFFHLLTWDEEGNETQLTDSELVQLENLFTIECKARI